MHVGFYETGQDRSPLTIDESRILGDGDAKTSLILSGTGDVLEPEDGLIGIGSGGVYALAAGKALLSADLSAEDIAKRAMEIAASICVYTNESILIESLATT